MSTRRSDDRLIPLEVDVCLNLLASRHVGRVAVNDEHGPVVFPVNYAILDDTVVFRTGAGTKLTAANAAALVAFQVDHVDVGRRSGWSVLVRGRLAEVTDEAELARLADLPLEPFAGGDRDHHVRIATPVLSGRRIVVPASVPDEWLLPTFAPDWSLDSRFQRTTDYTWDLPGWV